MITLTSLPVLFAGVFTLLMIVLLAGMMWLLHRNDQRKEG